MLYLFECLDHPATNDRLERLSNLKMFCDDRHSLFSAISWSECNISIGSGLCSVVESYPGMRGAMVSHRPRAHRHMCVRRETLRVSSR
jgi:hypothetical protein